MNRDYINVTIRSKKCIDFLRERKRHGISYSAMVTDIILDYLENKNNQAKPPIHVYVGSDGVGRMQPPGPPRPQDRPDGGKDRAALMMEVQMELRSVLEDVRKGKYLKRVRP